MPYAKSEKMILAEISLEIEFKIYEMTILLFLIQELWKFRSVTSGFGRVPSMNLSLFLIDNAIVMALLHDA